MAAPVSSDEFLDLVRKSGICPADSLDQRLEQTENLPNDPTQLATLLVKCGLLTPFQAKLLLSGRYRGFRLGAYIIREQIGQGGMGAVYLAEHETLRRRVAIKVLAPNEGMNKVAVERFLREARAAAALDHPNIVRIFDVAQQGDMYFLVLEFVDGQTLDQIIERSGPMPCGRAVEYILQAAAGLQHACEKGFVHRDIKPGNLILGKDGTVKLLDMGLARSMELKDKLTEVLDKGAVVGTADYISPEQAMNSPDLDIRADIYSLGATFFTLVTGRPPFDGNTTQKLLQHQMKEPPTLDTIDKTFPPGLADVVVKMLRKKPADRYQTPAEVIAALGPWLPNNARVVATLSRTNMGNSNDLQNTLNEVVSGRTKRINNTAQAEQPTPKKPRSKLLYVMGGLLSLAIIGGGAFAAIQYGGFGNETTVASKNGPTKTTPPNDNSTTTPPTTTEAVTPGIKSSGTETSKGTTKTGTKTGTKGEGETKAPPTPKPAAGQVAPIGTTIYDLDLRNAKPYTERGKMAQDPGMPETKRWVSQNRTGEGQNPTGWRTRSWSVDSLVEYSISEVKGSMCISIATLTGPASAMLFTPDLQFNQPKCRLHIEYMTDQASAMVPMKFRALKPSEMAATEFIKLPGTKGEWKSQDIELDLNGATGGYIEFHNSAKENHPFWIRAFTVTEEAPMTKALMKLDLTNQEPFLMKVVVQDAGSTRKMNIIEEQGPGKMPTSWYRWIDKNDTICEYFADNTLNRMAVGTRILSGTGGVMLNSPEFKTKAGKVTARFVYRSGSDAAITTVRLRQTADGKKTHDVITLPANSDGWRQVVVAVDMQGATAGLLEFLSTTAGEAGAFRLSEVLVTEE